MYVTIADVSNSQLFEGECTTQRGGGEYVSPSRVIERRNLAHRMVLLCVFGMGSSNSVRESNSLQHEARM